MQKNSRQKSKILLKSSLVLVLLVILMGCSTPFEKTQNQVEKIEIKYGISLADYAQGLSYFDTHIRAVPINIEELNAIISQLEKLKKGKDDESIRYLNFRIKLLEAEKLYKSASRRPFAGINDVIRCSKKQELLISIDEVRKAINVSTDAVETYLKEEVNVNLTEEWVHGLLNDNGQIYQDMLQKESTIISFCNLSQTE